MVDGNIPVFESGMDAGWKRAMRTERITMIFGQIPRCAAVSYDVQSSRGVRSEENKAEERDVVWGQRGRMAIRRRRLLIAGDV